MDVQKENRLHALDAVRMANEVQPIKANKVRLLASNQSYEIAFQYGEQCTAVTLTRKQFKDLVKDAFHLDYNSSS